MTSRFLLALAGHSHARTAALASATVMAAQRERQRILSEDDVFHASMTDRRRQDCVTLGEDRSGAPYLIPAADFMSAHTWVSAATGAGKSRIVGGLVSQLLKDSAAGAPISTVVFDMKGELADLVLRAAAGLAATLPSVQCAAFLSSIRVIRPFAGNYLPPLQLLRPEKSVSVMTQAHAVAEALEMAGEAQLGVRQSRSLTFLLALGIDAGLSLPELRWRLFYDRPGVVELAQKSKEPELRLYFARSFGSEEATSLEGVAARLDTVLRVDALKASLGADTMFDFRACYLPGLTVLDFGDPPLGAEGAARTVAALLLPRLVWSAFSPDRPRGNKMLLVADEIQLALGGAGSNAHHLNRVLEVGRSAGISLVSMHQQLGQLPREFADALEQNVRFRILGRSAVADAEASAEWLPISGGAPRQRPAWEPPGLNVKYASKTEELAQRVADLGRLPQRTFLVGDRLAPFRSRLVTAAPWVPPGWDTIPRDVADAVLRGVAGIPRSDLLERARRCEGEIAAVLEGKGVNAAPGRRRGVAGAPPVLPNLVGAVGGLSGRRPGGIP